MTGPDNTNTTTRQAINPILESGPDGPPGAIAVRVDQAMPTGRSGHIGARPYERAGQGGGHAGGSRAKTLQTRTGKVQARVPQVRDPSGPSYPPASERGQRSEVAPKVATAEMYLQGVPTRRVTRAMGEPCGPGATSTGVGRATASPGDMSEAWRNRDIGGGISHLVTGARYGKVRVAGQVRSRALPVAIGARKADGKRTVPGCPVSPSEAEAHWRESFKPPKARGPGLPRMITSDAHGGIEAAPAACFPGVPWQRCQFHLGQDAGAHVPKTEMEAGVAGAPRRLSDATGRTGADNRIAGALETCRESAPKLAAWMGENLPEGPALLALPGPPRKRLRTSNAPGDLDMQTARRTRVCGISPNGASPLRLAAATLMGQPDGWDTGKAYLRPELP